MANDTNQTVARLSQRNRSFFIGPRPGKKSIARLAELRLTHCCTLLSEREGARSIKPICEKIGAAWVWLPIEGGKLDVLRNTNVTELIDTLSEAIADEPEPRLYFHCSAGIHRTGYFVYVLLRLTGMPRDEALAELTTMRPVTAEQVGAERIELADAILMGLPRPGL